ncbi:coiled-coil domain-containing protein CG32809-like isoform X2 [Littorina saxatilis]|uniref:coiled-coil domain-containing protein CG32809-like isoform X2 n=1 Tax=Littorina saxatilis TaxID=31220 RepID=UPI0038B533CB
MASQSDSGSTSSSHVEVSPSHSSGSSVDSGSSTPVFRPRPLSCDAVVDSALSLTSSSSCSSSATLTLTPTPTPYRSGSSGSSTGSTPASARTLVQPRSWRILPRSRMGTSLDRERAREEDTSLDGDLDSKNPDGYEIGSSVDGDDVFSTNEEGSSVDAVGRARSVSDVTRRKVNGSSTSSGESSKHLVGFKTRAERFSLKDDIKPARSRSVEPPKALTLTPVSTHPLSDAPRSMTSTSSHPLAEKSQTLTPKNAHPPTEMSRSLTLPLDSSLVQNALDRRGRSTSRTPDRTKTVKFSEPEKIDLSPTKSDKSSDSPIRNVTVDVRDNAFRVSFSKASKPVTPEKPLTSEKPLSSEKPLMQTDKAGKPEVPEKPARLSWVLNGLTPTNEPKESQQASKTNLSTSSTPPKGDSTKQGRKTQGIGSPKSPVEDVLFSMGFTIADEKQKASKSKTANGKEQKSAEVDAVSSGEQKSSSESKSVPGIALDKNCNSETKPEESECEVSGKVDQADEAVQTSDEALNERGIDVGKGAPPEKQETPLVLTSSDTNVDRIADRKPSKSEQKEIVTKKMMKIKGDKKAEEKAAKAKKKEQKAREKELKAKKKSAASDHESDHEKGRVKLFSWKVEFSAKDKSTHAPDTSKCKEDKKKKEHKKLKLFGKDSVDTGYSSEPSSGVLTIHDAKKADEVESDAASTKKSDRGDGGSSGSSSKSPLDKKSPPATQKPPPEQQQQQQQQDHQHQSQQHPLQQMQDPLCAHREPSVSPQPRHRLTPSPQPARQQHPHPPPKPRYLEDLSSSEQNSDVDSLYGSLRRNQGMAAQISESDGETTPQGSNGQGRRPGPRRHTVGGAQIREQLLHIDDTERKREAFYELLANRYPQYADKITGMAAFHATTAAERNPRPREPQRRRTTAVTYNPHLNRSLDYDDPGTMSDIEPPTFARGGYARASLPIVRSASSSLERPIGLVFLVYRDETKKALLPNEITTLDTVRALFVRAFPEKLSMEFLDSPKRKIYLLEATTSIFFQLEDLRDIQDHSVLKIHECDSEEPQRVKSYPEIRGRAVQPNSASSRPSSRQGYIGEGYRDDMSKAQSLPASSSQMYQELMHKERAQWEMEQEYLHAQHRRSRSRSQTPEPAERPRSLSTGAPRSRYSHSPDRLPTPERGPPHLIPIPENPRMVANGFRESMNGGHYEALAASRSHPHPPSGHLDPPPHPGRGISPTPGGQGIYESVYGSGGYHNPQSYVSHSTRASLPQGPQRATGPPPPDMRRAGPPNRHSLAFAAMSNPIYDSFPQRTQSYRPAPERDVLPPRPQSTNPHEIHRMERMEQQIASLAAWVHQAQSPPSEPVRRGPGSSRSTSSGHSDGTDTYPGSSASSLSDIPTSYSVRNPVVTHDMKEKINDLQCRMQELRVELQGLRRMEQLNQEAMREAFSDTLCKLRTVMGAVPGADNQVIRHQRLEISSLAEAYLQDKTRVEKELSDLERSVDELKEDVLNRKCRINVSDVEGLALMLSNITKTLADQKVRFPQVRDNLKRVMAGEVEIVVKEEKFLKDEPLQIDSALKRCKNLTSTLYTLKRLAAVQDTRPPQIPTVAMESKEVGDHEKMAILESIRAMVPDHDNRLEKLEAADASRERKKKIVTQQESLRFTKTLQTATKSLKPADTQTSSGKAKSDSETDCKKSAAGSEWDNRKTEPPEIPAKPARLMSASEVKKLEAGGGSGHGGSELATSHPLSPVSHTVTVTSQISDSGDKKVTSEDVSSHRSSARSAFFSSMQSPPTSPMSKSDGSKTSSKLPSASKAGGGSSSGPTSSTASSSSSSISPSHSKQASGVYFQALSPTKSRSAFSSIPLPSKPSAAADKDDCADKGRKVPPPPPPRKSSAKYPLGLTSSSLSPNANGGVETSQVRRNSGDRSADTRSKVTSPKSPTASGPLSSSTPKPVTPQKPAMSKFQKDLAAGIYSNLNRPDLQNQKMTPDRLLTTMVSPPPAAVTTNSQDPQDEADLSGSESTGSSTSLDSQQGVALLRSNSSALAANRGPKPHPPQRHSSLSAKGSSSEDSGTKTKTQMLQERVRKSQEAGKSSAFPQVNGLNGAKNGHKT